MDLIRKINRSHGLGVGDTKRSRDDPVVVLRGRLERACERLSRDLYNTKTHFLLEFIQNADDNDYDANVIPNLQLHLHGHQLLIRCNEKGFRADNVEAICDVGHSTKKKELGAEGYIGEKGIGFKAVFAVADRVHVASREFTFRFDRDGPLGMINPVWDPSHPSDPGWTTFRLEMPRAMNTSDLRSEIRAIQPTLLLFLRRLRTIDIDVAHTQPASRSPQVTISRTDEPGNVVRLESHEDGLCTSSSQYIVFKETTRTFTGEEKRQGIMESEVVLAFPVTSDGEPDIGDQFVHAFLPVARYGLPFVVQADFLTPSSREGIIVDSKWNLSLFEGIISAFLRAVEHFQQDPVLRHCWVRYIPTHAQAPFSAVAERIIARLQDREVLLSLDGRYCRPQDIVTIPKGFCINRTEPLIPSRYLPSVYYLSDLYDVSSDRRYLAKLGVKSLSDQNILDGLENMERADAISVQDDQWHNIVCAYLIDMPRPNGTINKQILGLRLLPGNDGMWHAARDANQYVFTSDLDIVQDVEFKCITNDVREHSARYTFLQTLGVRRTDPALIATKILFQSNQSASLPALIRYARFFYENRNQGAVPQPSAKFKMMDENCCLTMSDELYLEMPDGIPGCEFKLRDFLPSDARFIHQDYVEPFSTDRYWFLWLQDSLGLNTSPRVISGRLSPEFYAMARSRDTARFLTGLRVFWPQITASISPLGMTELSNIEVVCDDGIPYPLRTTSLKRRNLAWLPPTLSSCLHFIPVTDPDDLSWGFLARLGVTMEVNASAWVGMLFRLQEMNCADEATVISVYQQLNARFVEASEFIRASFWQYPLIFAPPDEQNRPTATWLTCSDVYWDGPSTLRSKFIVKSTYATLDDFFCWKLGLQNAPLEILVEELSTFATQHEGHALTEDTLLILERMLVEISDFIIAKPASQFCLLGLAERSIFPVHIGGEVRLQRIDQLFISEKGGKSTERFRGTVPILAISSAQTLSQLRPMLQSHVWPSPPRVLESSLVTKTIALGSKVKNQEATDLYSTRSEYMEKYVQHVTKYCPSSRQMEFLAKMRKTSIFVVDTVIVMWSLDGKPVNVQSGVKVSIEEATDQVTFYVSKACAAMPHTQDREICSLLGDRDRVALDKLALMQFVSMSWEELLPYLEDEGVDISTCIPQTMQEPTYEPEQPDTTPVGTPVLQPLPSRPPVVVEAPPVTLTPARPSPVVPSPVAPSSVAPSPVALSSSAPSSSAPSPAPPPPLAPSSAGRSSVESAGVHVGRRPVRADSARTNGAGLRPEAPPFHMTSPLSPATVPKIENRDNAEGWRAQSTSPPQRPLASVGGSAPRRRASTVDHHAVQQLEMTSATTPLSPPQQARPEVNMHVRGATNGAVAGGVLASQQDDRDPANGVLGELYVFRMMQRVLGPDFAEHNWTSELRSEVLGFTPYNGPSLADFRYVDRSGVLTNLWYGKKQKNAWKGRWPTYHLEVKTTSGTLNEPFHMSAAQLQLARQFSSAAQAGQGPPQDIYVIIRVSEVKTVQPKHHIYLDPHKWIYDGGLVIKCDVDLVPQ